MKRVALLLALAMVVGFAGTAMAADQVRNFNNTQNFYASPVSIGTTTYILTTSPFESTVGNTTGATVWQINPSSGASSVWGGAFNPENKTSAYGTPVLFQASGDSGVTLVMNVYQTTSTPAAGGLSAQAGTSLWAVYFNSTGTAVTQWSLSLPALSTQLRVNYPVYANNASTGWTTPLLVDTGTLGTTVYGTSGVSVSGSGASLWAVSLGAQTGSVSLSNNQWNGGSASTSAVSSFIVTPVISGNSLFALGEFGHGTASGTSLFMFDKTKLQAGPNSTVNVIQTNKAGTSVFATPAVSGNSLFVVDTTGGLTAYSIAPANILGATRGTDFRQLSGSNATAVTASPVTDSEFLVVAANFPTAGRAGVSVFTIKNRQLNADTGVSWWYEWTGGVTVTATPAISNGYVYVAINRPSDGAEIYRFKLNQGNVGAAGTFDKIWTTDKNSNPFGFVEYSSPIISGNNLIFLSNSNGKKRLYSLDISDKANSFNYWKQFKADAARTGDNTAAAEDTPAAAEDDDSGCFISTIK